MNNLFLNHTISQLHALIDQKEISYKDIIAECVNKTNALDKKFHMWEHFDEQLLYDQANVITNDLQNRIGLTYVPVAVKDVFNTQLYPTQMGSPLWKDFTPGNDARIVHNIREAGAIIAGKTVTAEFAVHALNKTLNPHDVTLTPGTSSSGSAAAIAVGAVPVALGTQTAASIVRPASFCGIYGFKPSFGLIPRTGMLKTTDSLDTIGFFTIHYKDLLDVFEVIRVRGKNYPLSNAALNDQQRQNKPNDRPWRVAFIKTYTWDETEDYARVNMDEYIQRLSQLKDIEIKEVNLPEEFDGCHDTHATIYNKTLSYYFQHEYENPEFVSEVMVDLIERGKNITPSEYALAIQSQNELCQSMDRLMEDYDVLISLSTAGAAPLRETEEKPDPSLIWNMTHLPTVAVPAFSTENQLPFGFQVCARRYNDYLLLNFLDYLYENRLIPEKMNPLYSEKANLAHI